MKVLYLTQVLETESDPGSDRHFFLCRFLVERGHRVTALTSNVDYKRATVKLPGAGWRVWREVDGVRVGYVYSYPHFRGSFARRLLYFLSYLVVTALAGARVKGTDVVYAVSTPLTVGLLGFVVSRIHRVPFFFEVTDVWPDAAVAVGVVKNAAVIRAASWLEQFCYRKAQRIVALTQGIRANLISKGVPAEKVLLATNGVDAALFRSGDDVDAAARRLRDQFQFDDRLACMYLGAHGRYNALDTIVEAASALRDDPRFLFVLVGDGDEKQSLESRAARQGLANIRFLPPVPRAATPALLRSADVFLLPNRKGDFFKMNLPNKLFDFLASARPIIVAGEGESADLVREAKAGLVVPAEEANSLTEALKELAALGPDARVAMGESGRELVLERYNRNRICESIAQALEDVAGSPSIRTPGARASVRRAELKDVDAIVDVHMSSFPGFFLTFLGPRFLRELYSALLSDPAGIVLVAEGNGTTGFVAGTVCPEGFYRRLISQRWWRFGLASLGAVTRRPRTIVRLIRALSKPRESAPVQNDAFLMSVAVLPDRQHSGSGRMLVRSFAEEVVSRGASSVVLTTDRDGNEPVNAFYKSVGFVLNRTFVTPEGRAMNEYRLRVGT